MEQELKVKISGDIDDLKKATTEAEKELDGLVAAQKRVNDGLKSLTSTSLQYEKALKDLNENYRRGNLSQEQFAKESEKLSTALAENRNEIRVYQRESNRLTKEIDRSKRAFEQSALSTRKDTVAKKTNANADKQAARATSQLEAAQRRQAEAQRQALMGANSMGRAMTGMAVGGRSASIGVGTLTRALSTMAVSSTAATGGLTAFTSALMGPAGITVAVSLAVTALTGYIASKASAKRAADDATSANKTYIESLEGIARAAAEGEQAANRDLTNLRLLYEATQNLTLPMEARRKAAEELIRQYPKQFEGMTTEAVLAGRAASAYNQLTASITATAMAAANLDRIRDNSNKILENRLEMLDKQNKLNELNAKIAREEATTPLPGSRAGQSGEALDAADNRRLSRLYDERRELIIGINQLGEESGKITSENIQLQNEYNNQILKGADLSGSLSTGLEKAGKATKEQSDKLAEALIKNENRVQAAIREGRDKEIEEARVRYEALYALAGNNSEARIQIAEQEAEELAAINRKYDEKEQDELNKLLAARAKKIHDNAKKIRNDLAKEDEAARKKRLSEEQKLLRKLEQEQRRYARVIGGELSRAFEGFLTRGESIFKALGDAFKRMIIRMVSEAAALKTIQFLQGAMGGSGGGGGGGFWGFLGGLLNFGSKFVSSSGYSSGSFSTGNYGGGNFPSTNPIRGGGFVPGVMASSNQTMNVNVTGKISGNDLMVIGNRADRFNSRFNGGQ